MDLATSLSILGIIIPSALAVYFYVKSRDRVLPCWSIHTLYLVTKGVVTLPGLEVRYQGKRIDQLTVTRIAFWNRGSRTLRGQDLVPRDKLRIEVAQGVELLKAAIVRVSHEANGVRVTGDLPDVAAEILLDYLDQGQGFVAEVIHTGRNSSDVRMEGSVMGARNLKYVRFDTDRESIAVRIMMMAVRRFINESRPLFTWVVVIAAVVLTIKPLLAVLVIASAHVSATNADSGKWSLVGSGAIAALVLYGVIPVPRSSLPKGLAMSAEMPDSSGGFVAAGTLAEEEPGNSS